MYNSGQLRKFFQKIQVIRSPKHRLATFGNSRIHYSLVTDVPGLPDRSRLRTGHVTAEKPAIITPQALRQHFQGFSSEASDYADMLISQYGKALRGLEYQFRNEPISSEIELSSPEIILKRLTDQYDQEGDFHRVIIQGTDRLWELSIMKFIVEETLASFAINMQELQERGFFEDENRTYLRQRREVETLLRRAANDRTLIPQIGAKLKQYNLFEEFQDAFFKLVNR